MFLDALGSPRVFSNSLYLLSVFTLPINIFGTYCILFKTPDSMKSVKWNMLNLHIWGTCSDLIISILTQPFICTPDYAGTMLGALRFLPPPILLYTSFTTFVMSPFAIVSMFENRFFLLFAKETWWKHARYFLLGFNYFFGAFHLIPAFITAPDQKYVREELFKEQPNLLQYDSIESPIYILVWKTKWLSFLQQFLIVFITTQALTFVFLISYNMRKAIKLMTLSESTIRLQKEFMSAMKLQVFIPIMAILVPSVVLAVFVSNEISNEAANNFIFMITSSHGAVSAIAMLYLHKPYREFCKKFFCSIARFESNTVSFT